MDARLVNEFILRSLTRDIQRDVVIDRLAWTLTLALLIGAWLLMQAH